MVNRNYPQAILHSSGVKAYRGEIAGLSDTEIRQEGAKRFGKIVVATVLAAAGLAGLYEAGNYGLDHERSLVEQQQSHQQGNVNLQNSEQMPHQQAQPAPISPTEVTMRGTTH